MRVYYIIFTNLNISDENYFFLNSANAAIKPFMKLPDKNLNFPANIAIAPTTVDISFLMVVICSSAF